MSAMKAIAIEQLNVWEKEVAAIILENGEYDLADFDDADIISLHPMSAEDAARTILNWMVPIDPSDPGDMDGDHDSSMASAGFGTDEDYGCYGEDIC